ncbi:MAG: DUF2946 family protein [Burkholderiaceae bacterium]
MQSLRRTRQLARLVLAWFVLSIGAAVASPMVKPVQMELICSGAGIVKLLIKSDDGAPNTAVHALDCPLCLDLGSPLPLPRISVAPLQPLSDALPVYVAPVACEAAPSPRARGPPVLS